MSSSNNTVPNVFQPKLITSLTLQNIIMEETIANKVAESGLVTLDLETFFPTGETMVFDLKEHLFMGLILKEKDFREALKSMDWKPYENKNVALTCSADAIIPVWAYMLVVTYLQPLAKEIVFGNEDFLHQYLFIKNLSQINLSDFDGKRVVIKGCGDKPIPESAYVEVTRLLRPVVKSIMYGEPCSTVPIFKSKKES